MGPNGQVDSIVYTNTLHAAAGVAPRPRFFEPASGVSTIRLNETAHLGFCAAVPLLCRLPTFTAVVRG